MTPWWVRNVWDIAVFWTIALLVVFVSLAIMRFTPVLNPEVESLRKREQQCTRCPLRAGCTQVVPGIGPSPAPIMIVGEAPGADEDKQGLPFVGASGQLLSRMLEAAKIDREAIWVSNVVRCRPPDNRRPEPAEIAACKMWLWEEMKLVDPLVVVALGNTPAKLLLRGKSTFKISRVVGQPQPADFLKEQGIVVPMYHPSYLLRQSEKDVQEATRIFVKVRNYVDARVHTVGVC